MRTNTLHSNWEWKQITGEMPIQVNVRKPGRIAMQGPYDAKSIEGHREKLAPYIQISNRKTRQGILFDIIRSNAPYAVIRNALW